MKNRQRGDNRNQEYPTDNKQKSQVCDNPQNQQNKT